MSDFGKTSDSQELSSGESLRFYARRMQRHPIVEHVKRPLRAAKSFVPTLWRRATQELRELPSVVIVGAQKAGTTQLYAYLLNHPRMFHASRKEVSYFSKHAKRSVGWYRSHFPLSRRVAAVRGHTLDASPSYLPTPAALWRMREVLPQARIIVVLRDPVARAFSHYQHYKTRGVETRSFEQAVADELRQNDFPPRLGRPLRPDSPPMLGYVGRGYYALQLELLLKLYGRDQVLILDSAELFSDTNVACQQVFAFLAIEPFEVVPTKVYNRGYYKERIDVAAADHLRNHFRPYDELLVDIVGRPFGWMRHAVAA
jgi:hypothetical protein